MHVIAMVLCSFHVAARIVAAGFTAEVARLYDDAAAATDLQGADTVASLDIFQKRVPSTERSFGTSIAVARVIESATLVLVASGFLLFFPASIVMFRRVERRLDTVLQEMSLRSDHGTVLLPFEFSPPSSNDSATQTELPITDARQFLNSVKAAAVSQRNTFLFCLFFVLVALLVFSSLTVFVFAIAVQPYRENNLSCGYCGPCRGVEYIVLAWFRRAPELFLLVTSICSAPPLVFSLWLMTTPDDRKLLLHPHKFLAGARGSIEDEGKAKLRTEAFRMGINLR
jgi:hypothetical protein